MEFLRHDEYPDCCSDFLLCLPCPTDKHKVRMLPIWIPRRFSQRDSPAVGHRQPSRLPSTPVTGCIPDSTVWKTI